MVTMNGAKKWGGYFALVAIPTLAGLIARMYFPLKEIFMPIIITMVVGVVMMVVVNKTLKNPFSEVYEGQGFFLWDFVSLGRINTYLAKINSPYLTAKVNNKEIETIFDNGIRHDFGYPQPMEMAEDDKYRYFRIDKSQEHKIVYGVNSWLGFVWNSKMNAPITKEALNDIESTTLIDHQLLYLSARQDEMSKYVKFFANYMIELLKKNKAVGFLQNNMGMILVVVVILIIAAIVGPQLLGGFGKAAGAVVSTGSQVGTGLTVPKI